MKTKKFMSLILALAMAFSLAVPAFASGSTATPIANTDVTDMGKIDTAVTTVNVGYQAPVLALTVPKTVAAMLNPYKLNLTLNKDTAIEEDVTDQVASAYNMIISRSSVPLTIKAKATGTIAGPTDKLMTLAKTNVAADSVKKEAYVWMQFGAVDTSTVNDAAKVTAFMQATPSTTSGQQPFTGIDETKITWATTPGTYTNAETPVEGVIIAAGEGKEHLIDDTKYQLDQVTFDPSDATKATSVSAVAFRLNGNMVPNPKDAPWGKEDKLTVSVAWKFVPGQQGGASANADATVTLAAADTTATATIDALNVSGTVADQTIAITLPTGAEGLTLDTVTNFSLTPTGGTTNAAGNVAVALSGNTLTLTGANIKSVLSAESGITGGSGTFNIKYKSDSSQTSADKTVALTVSFTGVVQS